MTQVHTPPPPPQKWTVLGPEGYYDSMQVTGTMVAPILAGFTFTILALVLIPPAHGDADPLRWRDQVLALLVFSALLLILSTQAAMRARATLVKPDELRASFPAQMMSDGRPNEWLEGHQKSLDARTRNASTGCRHTYNAGTLLLFTAIAVLLVPSGHVDDTRRLVLAAATAAVAIEAAWLSGMSLRGENIWERVPTLAAPAAYSVGAILILAIGSGGASHAAAAASIVIAGAAATAPASRMVHAGGGLRILGSLMLAATLGAAAAGILLLVRWADAAWLTGAVACALVVLLAAAMCWGQIRRPGDAASAGQLTHVGEPQAT